MLCETRPVSSYGTFLGVSWGSGQCLLVPWTLETPGSHLLMLRLAERESRGVALRGVHTGAGGSLDSRGQEVEGQDSEFRDSLGACVGAEEQVISQGLPGVDCWGGPGPPYQDGKVDGRAFGGEVSEFSLERFCPGVTGCGGQCHRTRWLWRPRGEETVLVRGQKGRTQVPGQVDVRTEGGGGDGSPGRTRGLAEIRRERLIVSVERPKRSGRHRPKRDPLDGTKCF